MMDYYQSGEIEEVLKSFEKALELNFIYVGCKIERSEKETKVMPDGRIKKIYRTYYDNGHLNDMFKLYFSGYSAGKLEGRLIASHDEHWQSCAECHPKAHTESR